MRKLLVSIVVILSLSVSSCQNEGLNKVRSFFGKSYEIPTEEISDTTWIDSTNVDDTVETKIYSIGAPTETIMMKERIYRVIVASFREENMAIDYIDQLQPESLGYYNTEVLEQADNGFYRVSLVYFSKYQESIDLIEKFKADSTDAWLLRDSI